MNKKWIVISALTASLIAGASAIKVWSAEVLYFVDLNTNFAHLHDNMVGGHGARLVNADVSASAAIAVSKLAVNPLSAKAFVLVEVECTASPCTIQMQSPASFISGITRAAAGTYTATFTSTRANNDYVVHANSATASTVCQTNTYTTTTFNIYCQSFAGPGTIDDASFSIVVFDDL